MLDGSSISVVLANANRTGTTHPARGEIKFDALLVIDLRREHHVVLDPAEHHHAFLLLILHNLPGWRRPDPAGRAV
ncbi:MAG: hypothetical protein BGO47_06265 [Microbacterium sp. 67-17]|uniref:hypothetical protein n=1 Tax=Microbacterium sp. 67-17 TaxID=1895782 RepID=UPI0009634506|nr:hypothetical protein [Microbacterium sp. 67-17]OJV93533.1 MAG: hypothetical protein BGO47_06265 [Microbacterium sp. 67-17]